MTAAAFTTSTAESANVRAALRLARVGLPAFPVNVIYSPRTCKWEKKPAIDQWQARATCDETELRRLWLRHPDAVPGIELRRAGLVVIDADRHGGPDGVKAFRALGGDLPSHPVVLTAGHGEHHYFGQPDGEPLGNGRGALPEGLDVRGAGGLTVAPGSIRRDGNGWVSATGTPDLAECYAAGSIPPLPGWLARLIRAYRPRGNGADRPDSGTADSKPNAGPRERAYGLRALEENARELAAKRQPGRNDLLNALAFRMGRMVGSGWIGRDEVARALWEACEANGLLRDDGPTKVRATLESGLTAGEAEPHPGLGDRDRGDGTGRREEHEAKEEPRQEQHEQSETDQPRPFRTFWHGETKADATPQWLIKNMLPQTGVGLLSGQWGTFKTFLGLDLAASVMSGHPFAGRKVVRRGGVLFIAAEGAHEIPIRLRGLVARKFQPFIGPIDMSGERLPFAWIEECPSIQDPKNFARLVATATAAADRIHREFELPLSLIMLDTIAAAAGFKDEDKAAEAQAVMGLLHTLSRETSAFVLGIDHFGKMVETGTRGSSAKEAAADAVLALLADRTISGEVTNTRMAIRKVRGAPTGMEIPYTPETIKLGVDLDGEPITTCVLSWRTERNGETASPPPKEKWPHRLHIFKKALEVALIEHGRDMRPFGAEGPLVRAVDMAKLRAEFFASYPAEGDTPEKKSEAKRKALKRATLDATTRGLVATREVNGVEFIWFVAMPEGGENAPY